MPSKVVVGTQWGDEGKGKIIDILASRADVVVRSQGGNNAGHTVENDTGVYKLSLVPSGILYPHTLCLIGAGVVVDPKSLLKEMAMLTDRGVKLDKLRIDARAHVVMPWHLAIDALGEDARGEQDIGTTRRGIGPAYMDKAERTGLRLFDLTHEGFGEKCRAAGARKNDLITKFYGGQPLDLDAIAEEYAEYGRQLSGFVDDVSVLTWKALQEDKQVLFEGAQGTLLDLDMGTYPFVTSSHPLSGGVCTGVGIGPTAIDEVIGVGKAYTTRVGKGPFPTELFDDTGDQIRDKGHEYGTNTGRPRRVGWFDAVIMRHAIRSNGLTSLSINKLDTLGGFPTLKICTSYRCSDGSVVNDFPPTIEMLADCEPVYEEIAGFGEDITGCTSFADLPQSCKNYIARLEEVCGCPISMVGVGPARTQNLER